MNRLRILTVNLWNGKADPAALADVLDETRPDVVAVQELSPNAARVIERALPHGRLDPADDTMGMGIALRHPAPVEYLPLPLRDARIARLDPADWPQLTTQVEVINAHLANPVLFPVTRSLRLRRQQVAELAAYQVRTHTPHRVLVGDLNSTPLWPAYRRLTEDLSDAAAHLSSNNGHRPGRTWAPRAATRPLLRIDHVLVNGLRPLDLRVIEIPGSDHAGVLADLEV